MIKKLLFTFVMAMLGSMAPTYAQITSADFLKANGTVLRKNSGTGAIVNLRGTNLGSWLSMEYWMAPLGTGALNRSTWIASASSTYPGTNLQSVFDRDLNTRWSNGSAQVADGSQYFQVDMKQNVVFNRISFEAGTFTGDYPREYKIEVSADGSTWETAATGNGTAADTFVQLPNIYFKRFVRITQTGSAANNYWSIAEFNLYMEDDFSVRNSLYTRFGVAGADDLLDHFQNTWITTTDLDNIKRMGLNMVRAPFFWMEIMNNDGTIKTNGFTQLDWLIAQCTSRGMYVILDLHGAPGGINGFITSGQAFTNTIWTDPAAQQMTVNLWKAIATRYKGNPAVAMYDLLNEPLSSDQTNHPIHRLYNTIYQEVRKIDPDHVISIGAFPGFSFVVPPSHYGWTNVVYQVHNYNEDKHNYNSQNGFIDAVLLDIANHQQNWNVPVLAGEFNFWNFPDLWQKYLRGLNALNVSWSNWAYKTKRVDNPVENWGYYDGNTNPAPDLHYDSPETIRSKWEQFGTANFRANTTLRNLVPPYTAVPAAQAPLGRTIWLKGNNGKYVSSEGNNNPMTCIKDVYNEWELFHIVDAGNGKVALKGSNGLYVSSENGSSSMMCNRTTIGDWEKFTFINIGDGKVALRGSNGKYVSSENGSGPMMCDKLQIAGWETFVWGDNSSGASMSRSPWRTEIALEGQPVSDFAIYPNPVAGDHIQIQTEMRSYHVQVADMQGRVLINKKRYKGPGTLNVSTLSPGTYLVKASHSNGATVRKLIVQ